MKLIVGLGNPGEKYEETRHNLGFAVLDALLQGLTPAGETVWKEDRKSNSLIAKIGDLILAKPQTFMNASGMAVSRIASFYKIKPENIWVIHDEIDLPLEEIRIVKGRGGAGHRGVESIIKELGTTDFFRFRLGIGHPGPGSGDKEVERYVLALFGKGERSKARRMVRKVVKSVRVALDEGLEKAMNQFK